MAPGFEEFALSHLPVDLFNSPVSHGLAPVERMPDIFNHIFWHKHSLIRFTVIYPFEKKWIHLSGPNLKIYTYLAKNLSNIAII